VSATQPAPRPILAARPGTHSRPPRAAAAITPHGPPGSEARSARPTDRHQGYPARPAKITAAAAPGHNRAGHLGTQLTAKTLD